MRDVLDSAVVEALQHAVGQTLPARDSDWARITELHVTHARTLFGVERCRRLTMLILSGCGPIDLGPLSGLTELECLVVRDSGLGSLDGIGDPPLIQLDLSRNLVTDLAPLLRMTRLQNVNTDGNPLSAESYEEVVPALRARGIRVTCSAPRDWQLTLRMRDAGLPYCCYRKAGGLRLNSPGLTHTDLPEFGHPVVHEDELEDLLTSDPARIHDLFARRAQM